MQGGSCALREGAPCKACCFHRPSCCKRGRVAATKAAAEAASAGGHRRRESNRRSGEGGCSEGRRGGERESAAAQTAVPNAETAMCGILWAVAPRHCEGVWLLGLQSRRFFCMCFLHRRGVAFIEASTNQSLSLIFPSLLRLPVKMSASSVTLGACSRTVHPVPDPGNAGVMG